MGHGSRELVADLPAITHTQRGTFDPANDASQWVPTVVPPSRDLIILIVDLRACVRPAMASFCGYTISFYTIK